MQFTSRRAFLTGRRSQRTPWEHFLARLRRVVEGSVFDFGTQADGARMVPAGMQDVFHARGLCHQFGVMLALDGMPFSARLAGEPVLWVEPGAAMARCERLGESDPRWFVQPGCLLGTLEAVGLHQFRDQPAHLTVAAWLADRRSCDWDAGHTADSGLVHAQVLLGDGTRANLGAFGVDNQKPLDNLRVQSMVPRLFELAASVSQASAASPFWEGGYRLDALRPADGCSINLAQLLLGHAGELGWVEWLVFDERLGQPLGRPYGERYGQRPEAAAAWREVDDVVKQLFDPDGLFPRPGQRFARPS
ncbi:hypothetical protein [Castellaniella sp.]|uniref:hypothetical protein n=1 Tax=Castellaniella sp. TaxID=1955812 RepID=UPI00356201D3